MLSYFSVIFDTDATELLEKNNTVESLNKIMLCYIITIQE